MVLSTGLLLSQIAKEGKGLPFLLKLQLLALLHAEHHTAVILAAGLAGAMRQVVSAAVGALDNAGRLQLPDRRASLIPALSGYFTLGYRHDLHLP